MSGRLSERVVLVTGSTGIAAAAAERLVAEGAQVFVTSRTEAHARDLVARLRAAGGSADWRAADLTVEADTIAAVDACVGAFGRIDGLLSVAGGSGRSFGDGPLHDLSADGWDRTMALNLRSQFLVARETVRRMLARPPRAGGARGSIVLLGSALASHPVPEDFATHAYAAAKGAIEALMTTTSAYYAPAGIRVNVIAPALTDTPMAARAARDLRLVAWARRKQPLAGGFIDPADIAPAAVYLLSDESRAVTGQVLAIDGGWSGQSISPSAST